MRIEGITYQINWKAFRKNTSFFIPCLDPKAAKEKIMRITRRLRYVVLIREVIEEDVKGVRVWKL
jgi:hypothetical protein